MKKVFSLICAFSFLAATAQIPDNFYKPNKRTLNL
jgi:hypothetical protein